MLLLGLSGLPSSSSSMLRACYFVLPCCLRYIPTMYVYPDGMEIRPLFLDC
jgi:hypothetical protein